MNHSTGQNQDSKSDPTSGQAFGASVTGRGHLLQNKPVEDRFAVYQWLGNDPAGHLTVMICADGAGSAGRSWAGAWMACRVVVQAVQERIGSRAGHSELTSPEAWTEARVKRLFERARRRIHSWSKILNAKPGDLATTLNLAVLGRDFSSFAQVGDGLIGYQVQDGQNGWHLANQPDQGEFAGETTFLTSPNWLDQIRVRTIYEPLERVFVSTDGLLPVILDQSSAQIHRPFVDPLFSALESRAIDANLKEASLTRFLQSDRLKSRCDDDLTLILANRIQDSVDG